ncbi:hypothetical protein [Rubripirellula obstinata]|uniref:hypothetical protein n=1 Tax=Rubripirellula obstinata TaxID=406547 RepID=UPI00122D2606|nr:hypothetical protein [Rubripirellula obstinata]
MEANALSTWDDWQTHRDLLGLTMARGRFRIKRTISRMLSPRRIVATALVIIYAVLYVTFGATILMNRQPASPQRLQLWLSGGMVLYAIYHALKAAWSSDQSILEISAAEKLWLGGAPIRRSSIVVHQITDIALATVIKSILLCTVLAVDVQGSDGFGVVRLGIGVFSALLLLEISRLIVVRFINSLNSIRRKRFQVVATLIAVAVAAQVIARIAAATPMGSPTPIYVFQTFSALGQTAACDAVQWLALPFSFAAKVAIASSFDWMTLLCLIIAVVMLPIAVELYVRLDRRCAARQVVDECSRLRSIQAVPHLGQRFNSDTTNDLQRKPWYHPSAWPSRLALSPLALIDTDAAAVAARTVSSVVRYRTTIFMSLLVPVLLCLSPLVTGRVLDQWLYVVGGIAMCTSLIAPAALKIDFRRDLSRLLLLRSLPVKPRSMVLGQLWFPFLITCFFQWTVIAIASMVLQPGMQQVCLWTGMLAALSAFTFAFENALFLAFPHSQRSQGIAMVLRTKLTFLGKSSLLVAAALVLAIWATVCRDNLNGPMSEIAIFAGAQFACWGLAAMTFLVATWCWKRFDISHDIAPE